jgi:molybdopterin synthase catalytic subunit
MRGGKTIVKVIQICGSSGSGKTTLIRSLVPLLAEKGAVAVVKHLGHHLFALPAGKDTTLFSEAGAQISAGIDSEKTVVVVDAISLLPLLDMFSSSSTSFTVLEGFKSLPLPKVIMGDLVGVENIVLDNPRPEMILAYLDRFPDYYTPCDLARDMWSDGLIASTCSLPAGSSNLPVPERREFYERFFPMISEMSKDMADGEGTVKVRIHLHQGLYFGGDDRVLFAVGGQTPREVMSAFSKVFDRIDSILRTALSAGRIDTCN